MIPRLTARKSAVPPEARATSSGAPWGWGECAFSDDKQHRYTLARVFDEPVLIPTASRRILWIMLNPSVADDSANDATIARCCTFSKAWGFDRMAVVNLFSLRATDPRDLLCVDNPEGDPENLTTIHQMAKDAHMVLCAWGNHGKLRKRASRVEAMLRGEEVVLYCLKVNAASGTPAHPLYMRGDMKPVVMLPEAGRVVARKPRKPRATESEWEVELTERQTTWTRGERTSFAELDAMRETMLRGPER